MCPCSLCSRNLSKDEWMGVWRRERAMSRWNCREGNDRCVDGSVENGKSDEWMGVWRRERATCGWECGQGKGRGVDGSVKKGKGDL